MILAMMSGWQGGLTVQDIGGGAYATAVAEPHDAWVDALGSATFGIVDVATLIHRLVQNADGTVDISGP